MMRLYKSELKEIISSYEVVEVIDGRIGDSIIKLSNKSEEVIFLKISSTTTTRVEMQNEYEMLSWLKSSNLRVPEILYFGEGEDESYMLLTCVPGISAHEDTDKFDKEEIIKICAKALLAVHGVDPASVPKKYRECLGVELDRIVEDVRNDRIDIQAFKDANDDREPQEVLDYLLERRSLFKGEVFTHGDYCLPNLMISDIGQYGFIDWSQGGIGDIYRDISPMVKSIRRNFGKEYEKLFFHYYGMDEGEVDFEKVAYYDLMDQFSYYKKED